MSEAGTPTSRTDRWKTVHERHELASETVNGHRLTLCRTCDDLHCEDCGPGAPEGATR